MFKIFDLILDNISLRIFLSLILIIISYLIKIYSLCRHNSLKYKSDLVNHIKNIYN